eukprot:GFYU01005909.1.p1 GENE.GFYU01005909.1~~GFYU01005909.1.p1  ORF type:complete len:535 (-),score=99.04 GFYU01005909.1:22-1452(-)
MSFSSSPKDSQGTRKRHNICMICDFFYPNHGGVEGHIFHLAQGLIQRGHKVIVCTHAWGNRTGVRYLSNGLKVYYIPMGYLAKTAAVIYPTFFSLFPLFRKICIREGITIVHGHQSTSVLSHEGILHARTMGIKACFTDHSLFNFSGTGEIHVNKCVKFTLSDIDQVICVSHTSRENTTLRAQLDPRIVSVVPNAVDASRFIPNHYARNNDKVTIVIISRLVYRKGIDLVINVIPEICKQFEFVNFIIGGDGPKKLDLEEMREKYGLHDRVELLGAVPHSEVAKVLNRGHIFLNTSLTEAFCMAIVEAASCGLLVVSTKVGGVPEVLPPHMIKFAEPEAEDIVQVICDAIPHSKTVNPVSFHNQVKNMYNWNDVAARTEKVYNKVTQKAPLPLIERLYKYQTGGPWAGIIFCFIIALDYLFLRWLEWSVPAGKIEKALDFPFEEYTRQQERLHSDESLKLHVDDFKNKKGETFVCQ